MRRIAGALAAGLMLGSACIAAADPVPRNAPAAGSVIARKTGEEVRFIDVSNWRGIDIHQDLLAGDELRTNALGSLAVLFADNTQVRLGRNTTLVVKEINPGADSRFSLETGSIWARAERGGEGLVIETPAAAAAIRGTDWTMTVVGDRTSLTVLEGKVELANQLGSVTVVPGEAASARIGQAPTKTVIVDADDREQMLFYLSLRDSFLILPTSPLSSREMREERAKISNVPEAARSGEQWLTLAEVALSYDGRAAAKKAADQARAFRLAPSQRARLDLVDAMIAASEKRYAEAAPLFTRAAPKLSGSRRAMAQYGGYFARSLADQNHIEQPPNGEASGPAGAIAAAWTAGFLKDIPAAIDIVRRAEQRYPGDATLPAIRAQLAILTDDRPQAEEAIKRSLALDPDDPTALEARARYRVVVQSDLEGALADATRASELMPGSTTVWNLLGIVQDSRGASREAEAAFLKGRELDPQDPLARANLALLYLEQGRVAKAKAEIDTAMAADPSFDIGLVARGRYYIQTGETEKAVQDLLAASTANPTHAQALLLLAAAYSDGGQTEPAEQALENADRLDPNDPVTATVAATIAIDDYDSDGAIRWAQEALKRARARGGAYSALSASLSEGSTLNDAFRLQGLDAWGRYYGDAVFDPFTASGYTDQALAGSAAPFVTRNGFGTVQAEPFQTQSAFSSFFQGLMLDPLMLANPERGSNLLRRPFFEGSLGGGFSKANGDWEWSTNAGLRAFTYDPVPWSVYLDFETPRTNDFRLINTPPAPELAGSGLDTDDDLINGTAYLTANPTANDRVVAYGNFNSLKDSLAVTLPPGVVPPGDIYEATNGTDTKLATGGIAWSHTFGYQNVANVAIFATDLSQTESSLRTEPFDTDIGRINISQDDEQNISYNSYIIAANHLYGAGPWTFRYGVEGGLLNFNTSLTSRLSFPDFPEVDPVTILDQRAESDAWLGRAYFDTNYEFSSSLQLETGLFATVIDGDDIQVNNIEPRLGVAWSPIDGHYLRVGYLRDTQAVGATTLAPIGVLGLQANQVPLDVGGYSDSMIARWDAEWSNSLFTSVEYQHQELRDLSIDQPAQFGFIDLSSGRIDRISATVNAWLGNGFGAFGTVAYADSENTDRDSADYGGMLPFVPDVTARFGVTYVNPINVKVTLAGTYVGERVGSAAGDLMDGYWTADAFLTWEPFDKRFEVDLSAYNLLDEEFDIAVNRPGWGRSFVGSVKVRF